MTATTTEEKPPKKPRKAKASVAAPGAGFPATQEDLVGAGDLARTGTAIVGTILRGTG